MFRDKTIIQRKIFLICIVKLIMITQLAARCYRLQKSKY